MGTVQIPKLLLTKIFFLNFSHLHYLSSNQISFPGTKDSSEVLEVLRRIGSWKWGMRRGIATFLPVSYLLQKKYTGLVAIILWYPSTVVFVLGVGKRCWIQKTFAIVKISALFLITRYFLFVGKIGLSYGSLERFPTPLLWLWILFLLPVPWEETAHLRTHMGSEAASTTSFQATAQVPLFHRTLQLMGHFLNSKITEIKLSLFYNIIWTFHSALFS